VLLAWSPSPSSSARSSSPGATRSPPDRLAALAASWSSPLDEHVTSSLW
jgi:hypothetical protein